MYIRSGRMAFSIGWGACSSSFAGKDLIQKGERGGIETGGTLLLFI